MKTAFIYSGQGQQYHGMGVDLCSKFSLIDDTYSIAKQILGYDLLMLDEGQLMDSYYIQPALYVLGYAITQLLTVNGIEADIVCGLSLGEYNALTSASVISFEEGLSIVCRRAKIMSEAFVPGETKMAACLKTNSKTLSDALENSNVEICNYNSPTNHVIGGYSKDIDILIPKLKSKKIMTIPLKMSSVSHMSLMNDAALKLRHVLEEYDYKKPIVPFLNNLDGGYQSEGFVDSLSRQISNPTQMGKIIDQLFKDGVRRFIEIGPKGSISRLVKEICGDGVLIQNVYDVKTLEGVMHG